jgi:hypothetical protein
VTLKGKARRMFRGSLIKRSTEPRGKATYTGKDLTEVGSLQRKLIPDRSDRTRMSQPRLSGIGKTGGGPVRVQTCAEASATEEPDAEKLHVRVCAGGRRVTGVPTAEAC